MDNKSILIAILVVAVMALLGRIVINRQQKKNIAWAKIGSIALIVVVFIVVFIFFDAHRFVQWYKGKATLLEARTECISGREADDDIPHFTSLADTIPQNYYVIEASSLEPTGYFKLKNNNEINRSLSREVAETESNNVAITRKTTVFDISRTPGDNADKYIPIYFVTLKNGGKVVACMEQCDAKAGQLPIGIMRPMSDKLYNTIQKIDTLNTVEKNYYFNLFNEQQYALNQTNYLIYRAIAALSVAIVFGIIYMFIFKKNTSLRKH